VQLRNFTELFVILFLLVIAAVYLKKADTALDLPGTMFYKVVE
jgi:hypothetical protein